MPKRCVIPPWCTGVFLYICVFICTYVCISYISGFCGYLHLVWLTTFQQGHIFHFQVFVCWLLVAITYCLSKWTDVSSSRCCLIYLRLVSHRYARLLFPPRLSVIGPVVCVVSCALDVCVFLSYFIGSHLQLFQSWFPWSCGHRYRFLCWNFRDVSYFQWLAWWFVSFPVQCLFVLARFFRAYFGPSVALSNVRVFSTVCI